MNPILSARMRSIYLPAISLCIGICAALCGLIIWDTFVRDDSGIITMHQGRARGLHRPDGTLDVVYARGFTIHRSAEGELHRRLTCDCNKTHAIEEYDFPVVRRRFDAGDYPPVDRYLDSPLKLPYGAKCRLDVAGKWYQGRFAMGAKVHALDSIEFDVPPAP